MLLMVACGGSDESVSSPTPYHAPTPTTTAAQPTPTPTCGEYYNEQGELIRYG